MNEAELIDLCRRNGYFGLRLFPHGAAVLSAAIRQEPFSFAIVAGIDEWGVNDVWNYQNQAEAEEALSNWDPTKDPEPGGWIRHPRTGRRRAGGDSRKEVIRP
jgi:hypothetical protein